MEEAKLFTRIETAKRIRASLRALDNYKSAGLIGYLKIGGKVLFREVDIDTFLNRHAIPARADAMYS